MSNKYAEKMSKSTDGQLKEFIEDKGMYQDDFILAALNELKNRGQLSEEQLNLRETLDQKLSAASQEKEQKRNEPFFPPNLASTIKYAAYLLYFSVGLEIINAVVLHQITSMAAGVNNLKLELPTSALSLIFGIYIQKGKKIARNLFLIYALFMLLFLNISSNIEITEIISIVQSAVNIACIILLFSPGSRNWYKGQSLIN